MSPKRANQRIGRRGTSRAQRSLGARDPSLARASQADRGGSYRFPIQVSAEKGRSGLVELVHTGEVDDERGLLIASGSYLAMTLFERADVAVGAGAFNWSAAGTQEFPQNNVNFRLPVDLSLFDEFRWGFFMQTAGSAGSLILRYATTAAGTLVDLTTGGSSLSIATVGLKDSGWQDLAPDAQADGLYLGVGATGVAGAGRDLVRMRVEFRKA